MSRRARESGFTLVELLVYMSIVSIALLVFTNFYLDVARHSAGSRAMSEAQQTARFVLTRVSEDVRSSSTLPTFDPVSGLQLTVGGSPRCYALDAETVTVGGTCGTPGEAMTSSRIRVTAFQASVSTNGVDLRVVAEPIASLATTKPVTLATVVQPRIALY